MWSDQRMSVSEEFLEYILDLYREWDGVTARKMFGGAGLYRDEAMFGLIADDVLYLKVDESNRDDYERAGCEPFKPYPNKETIMSYYEVPPEALEDVQMLLRWSERSLEVQMREKLK